LIAGVLAGCVSSGEYDQAVADRNKWKASSQTLTAENQKIRDVVDQWVKAYNAKERKLNELSNLVSGDPRALLEKLEKLEKRVEAYEQDVQILEARNQSLQEDRDTFRNWYQIYQGRYNQAVRREQGLRRKSKVYEGMVKNLEKEVRAGNLKLEEIQGRLTVSVLDKIVFNAGGVDINPAGKAVLDKLAKLLKGITDKRIQVEGHTDNVPVRPRASLRYKDNWELSTLRAASVVRYLHEKGGVDPTLLSSVGYGPYQPVTTNKTPEGRRKNRRIEIVLTPLPKKKIAEAPGGSTAPGPNAPPASR
jgi:chemotaxis protein MotB